MYRREFLGALTAPVVVGVGADAWAQAAKPAPRKGRLKQGITAGVLRGMLFLAQDDFIKKEGTKRRLLGLGIGAVIGAAAGGASGGNAASAAEAGIAGAVVGAAIGAAWGGALSLDWDTVQENEADASAFKVVLNRNYDVREVRTLYASLQSAVRQDQRVGLGFMGNRRRTAERLANAEDMIGQTMKAEIDARQGKLTVTHPDFVRVMSTLKRDNGILSFYHDMTGIHLQQPLEDCDPLLQTAGAEVDLCERHVGRLVLRDAAQNALKKVNGRVHLPF